MKPTKHWYKERKGLGLPKWKHEVIENKPDIPKIECNRFKKNLLYRIKNRAKREGVPFDLSLEDFVLPSHCPALGIPLIMGTGSGPKPNSPSVSLREPEKGYVRGNIIIVSYQAWKTRHMNGQSLEDLIEITEFYKYSL